MKIMEYSNIGVVYEMMSLSLFHMENEWYMKTNKILIYVDLSKGFLFT